MKSNKNLMAQIAYLYYKKNFTQQEIAKKLNITRQTVSKLLSEAILENIVEITINNPMDVQSSLEQKLIKAFSLKSARVYTIASKDLFLQQWATAEATKEYLLPLLKEGNKKIALSWGKTIVTLIEQMPQTKTKNNEVYPLFGGSDGKEFCYSSNEVARAFAEKVEGNVHFAWFPYKTNSKEDYELFKKTSYYQEMEDCWNNLDIAILGIGNLQGIARLESFLGKIRNDNQEIGDIATHTYTIDGQITTKTNQTLCVPISSLKRTKDVIALAYGDDKIDAIIGALKTGIITTFITDEYTARALLKRI